MAKYDSIQNAFLAGELGERLKGRVDIDEYAKGAETLKNMVTMRQGGTTRRAGTIYQANLEDDNDQTTPQLIPFIVDRETAFVIAASFNDTPSLVLSIYDQDGDLATIAENDVSTITLRVQPDNYGFNYAQSGDILFLVHSSGRLPPTVIARNSAGNFLVYPYLTTESADTSQNTLDAEIWDANNVILRTPYRERNSTVIIQPSSYPGVGNTATLTSGWPIFSQWHVGSLWRTYDTTSGHENVWEITAVATPNSATGKILIQKYTTVGYDDTQESSWSNQRGFPRTVAIFKSRLIFGGNLDEPDRVWCSVTGNFFRMMQTKLTQDASTDDSGMNFYGAVSNDDPFDFAPASTEVNAIQWLVSKNYLEIGTLGTEYIARQVDGKFALTFLDVVAQTNHGSSNVQAAKVNQMTVFVTRNGSDLREFRFSEANGSFITKNLSILNREILKHNVGLEANWGVTPMGYVNVRQIVYQEARSLLWVITSTGALLGLTIEPNSEIIAWHRHTLGTEAANYPLVHSICVIPDSNGAHDNLWLAVERTVDNVVKYFLEKMPADFEHYQLSNQSPGEADHPWFVDCAARSYEAVATTTHSGFDHFGGDTVTVLADGVNIGEKVVDGGDIELDTAANEVIAGYHYTSRLKLLPIQAGVTVGTGHGIITRIHQAIARIWRSGPFDYGSEDDNLYTETPEDDLFTGLCTVDFPASPEQEGVVIIETSEPLPLTVLAITLRGVTYGV